MNPYRIATHLAPKSGHRWAKHVAIVVRGGAVISTASNSKSIHAEVAALNKLWPSERRGTKVWSMRMNKRGKFLLARPCYNCERYMRESGVRTVYYTNSVGDIIKEKYR